MRAGFIVAICLLFIFGAGANAQTVEGSIGGRVVDSSESAVAGARVTLTNEDTRDIRTVATDAAGDFLVLSVLPGRYTVTVQMDGFKRYEIKNINLTPSDRLSVGQMKLEVGAVVESITVKAEGAMVEIENSDRSAVMTTDQMTMLMSRDRNLNTLLNTIPGVVGFETNNFENRATPYFNGMPNGMNGITVDGLISNGVSNPHYANGVANIDSISEVKVLVNNFRAEYGRNGSAVITAVTKSGTRTFHGSAYQYVRNESMNANTYFNNLNSVPRAIYRYNTLGFTGGGPIYIPGKFNRNKDKLFFFFSEDRIHSKAGGLVQYTTPTELERQGDFSKTVDTNNKLITIQDPLNSKTAFPGNIVPASRINSNGQNLLKVFPLPNFFDRGISKGNYNYNFLSPSDSPVHQEVLRIDYNISSQLRFYFRGNTNYTPSTAYNADGQFSQSWPLANLHADWSNPALMLSGSYTLNPTTIIEFSGGNQGARIKVGPADGTDYSDLNRTKFGVNIKQLYPSNNPYNFLPSTNFGGVTGAANITPRGDFPDHFWGPRMNFNGSITKIHGNHTFKAGMYYERQRYYRTGSSNFNGTFAFSKDANNPLDSNFAYSNAMLGVFQSYTESSARNTYYLIGTVLDSYVQDTWKATRRLTLDYGIRFGTYTPWHQGNSLGMNFVPGAYDRGKSVVLFRPVLDAKGTRIAQNPLTGEVIPIPSLIGAIVPNSGIVKNGMVSQTDPGIPSGFVENRGLLPGPRAGFAYQITSDGKTALRGGIGIAYQVHLSPGTASPTVDNLGTTPTLYNGSFDTLAGSTGYLFPTSVSALNQQIKNPTVYNYSLGIQRALGFGSVLEVSYVGNLGRNMTQNQAANTVPLGSRFLPENYDPTTKKPLPDNYFVRYMGYSGVTIPRTSSTNYNSLQVRFNRRFARRMQYGVSYTWSKSMGYSGTYPTYLSNSLNYGVTSLDRTQSLVANWLYDVPGAGRYLRFTPAKWVLDGWQLSGIATFQSGAPASVSYSLSTGQDLTGGGDWNRPMVIAAPNLPRGERTFSRYFNTDAFAAPAVGSYGNAPNYSVRNPGRNVWDVSMFKNFAIKERLRFQFRAEAYNLFNHANFYSMNTSARFDGSGAQINAAFGQLTATAQARMMQVALRVMF